MRCDEIQDRLSDYLDGELAADERQQVHAHLESCSACQNELDMLREVIAGVKELPGLKAPDDFAESVMEQIPDEPAVVSRPRLRLRVFWPVAAALLIAVVVHLMMQQTPKEQPALSREFAARTDSDGRAFSRAETIGPADKPSPSFAADTEIRSFAKGGEVTEQRDKKIGEIRALELNGAVALDETTKYDPFVATNAIPNYRREQSRRVGEEAGATDDEKKEANGAASLAGDMYAFGDREEPATSMFNVQPGMVPLKSEMEAAPGKGAGVEFGDGHVAYAKQGEGLAKAMADRSQISESGAGGMQILQEQQKDGVFVVTVPSEDPKTALATAVAFARSNEWIPPAETAAAGLRVQERARLSQTGRAQLPAEVGKLALADANQLLIRLNEKELAELLAVVRLESAKPTERVMNALGSAAQAPSTQQQLQFSATQQTETQRLQRLETQQSQLLARGRALDQQLPLTDYLIVFVPETGQTAASISAEITPDAARMQKVDNATTETGTEK